MSSPRFTIGVTTYDRPELLRQCVETILAQEYGDFEVIVGNDYVSRGLSAEALGLKDPRVRVVNYEANLGEVGNLNMLLSLARGDYFTWQADDDYYDPGFLAEVERVLARDASLEAIFTSYHVVRSGRTPLRPVMQSGGSGDVRVLSGREFLREYWAHSIRVMGLTGVYRTDYLKRIGGVAGLGTGRIAVMSEWLVLVQCGLLERVAYVDRPLVYFQAHPGSWSATAADAAGYRVAGVDLLRRSLPILLDPRLRVRFPANLAGLLKLIVLTVAKVSARSRGIFRLREMLRYFDTLAQESRQHTCEPDKEDAEIALSRARRFLWLLTPGMLVLSVAPSRLRVLAQRVRGIARGELWS